jgi:hypothetical protein
LLIDSLGESIDATRVRCVQSLRRQPRPGPLDLDNVAVAVALALALFLALAAGAGSASAVELGGPDDPALLPASPFSLEIHGFVSQGIIKTTGNNYLAYSTERWSFEFSEVGINFTKRLTDRLRVGLQLFSRDLGPLGNYSAKLDWYYLDYHFADWLGLRAGRTKIPFGLYNEVNDIDSARVPILLPQSIYPIASRDFLLAQTGMELYGYRSLGAGGALDYRLYGGTIFYDANNQAGSSTTLANLKSPYVVGGRLLWETPLDGLRVGASLQALRLDFDVVLNAAAIAQAKMAGLTPDGFNGVVSVELPAILSVGSIEYAARELLLAAEYSIWRADYQSSDPLLVPEPATERQRLSERMYGMASYRLRPWFCPGVYYSLFFPRMDQRTPRYAHQHDVAGTLRFDINSFWLFKLEAHYMRGTASLDPLLNDNVPVSQLDGSWVVLLAKTTVSF